MELDKNAKLYKILDRARWAPSGDNIQPWRFHIESEMAFSIELHQPEHYLQGLEFHDGFPLKVSVGCLLEYIIQAARIEGYAVEYELDEAAGRIHVALDAQIKSGLFDESTLKTRSVHRFPFENKALADGLKNKIQAGMPDDVQLHWIEDAAQIQQNAKLAMHSTACFFRSAASFAMQDKNVKWQDQHPQLGLPISSVNIDIVTQKFMWFLSKKAKWLKKRLVHMPGGNLPVTYQTDYLPMKHAPAHIILSLAPNESEPPYSFERALKHGRSLALLWLLLEQQGVSLQPCYLLQALAFAHQNKQPFDQNPQISKRLDRYGKQFIDQVLGLFSIAPKDVVLFARIGYPSQESKSRSHRLDLEDLIVPN